MTEERKQELRQLLCEAMESVIIEASAGYEPISVEKYREDAKAFRESYRPDLSFILKYRPNIQDDAVKSTLFNFMKEELADYIREHDFEDEYLPTYWIQTAQAATRGKSRLIPCGLDSLLEKFLEIAIVSGTEQAILALDRCTRETSGTFQKIIFLKGLRVEYSGTIRGASDTQIRETQIAEGIRLVQLPNYTMKQMSDMSKRGQSGFVELPNYAAGFRPYLFQESFILSNDNPWFSEVSKSPMVLNLLFFGGALILIIDYTVSPLFCKPSVKSLEGVDISDQFEIKTKSAEFPNFDVDKLYHALSLIADYAVKPLFQWQYIGEDELFNVGDWWFTKLMRTRVMLDSGSGIHVIDETDIDKVKCLYQLLTNPSSNIGEKLKIPIDRWIKSKTSKTAVDKIVDLGIALEALYLFDRDGNSELSFQFRLRASWYLGRDKADREMLIDEFKAIYTLRSKAVHTGELPQTVKIRKGESVPISEFIPKAQDLCRQSIIKILEAGKFPDWNSLILGEDSL